MEIELVMAKLNSAPRCLQNVVAEVTLINHGKPTCHRIINKHETCRLVLGIIQRLLINKDAALRTHFLSLS
jgi:hypothetical protein